MNEIDIENLSIEEEVQIIFMGTPEFAVPVLDALNKNYNVRAIVTQPDKPVGRKGIIKPNPVKQYGIDHTIIDLKPTLIITCAYGQIVPRELLVYPKYGCINVHASLLPKLRGGAPIHRAIIEGHKKTGITIMHMNPRMDEGDIISQAEIEITDTDTASTLHDKLSVLGSELLIKTLPSIIDGTALREQQDDSKATYAFNIQKEDEKIDFDNTCRNIYNQVRGLNSWPGAYTILKGKRLKVWETRIGTNVYTGRLNGEIMKIYPDGIGVKCDNGEIILTSIQPEGKKKMSAKDYLNGLDEDTLIGEILG